MNPKKILIVAGEPSGDLYASILVKNLKEIRSDLEFFGIGGDLSARSGVEIVFDISGLALVGVVEVLKKISIVRKAYDGVIKRIDSQKVDLAILVDYPGFNLKLAQDLKKRDIPVVYYISPQVWAWGFNRIEIIKRCVKRIVVFFKFEEELYRRHGVDVKLVGHPLLDIVKTTDLKEVTFKKYGLSLKKTTIAILPGSRSIEVKSLLQILVSSSRIINERFNNTQFVIAKHPDLPDALYENTVMYSPFDIKIVSGDTYNVLGFSDFAIIASGTATLECAIIGVPFIIVYKTSFLTALLYWLVTKTPYLGLVNIIAKKEIVPELLQFNATPKRIAKKAIELLEDEGKRALMREDLKRIKSALGYQGASLRAAQAILPLLQ